MTPQGVPIEAFIWDIDQTLTNSEPAQLKSWIIEAEILFGPEFAEAVAPYLNKIFKTRRFHMLRPVLLIMMYKLITPSGRQTRDGHKQIPEQIRGRIIEASLQSAIMGLAEQAKSENIWSLAERVNADPRFNQAALAVNLIFDEGRNKLLVQQARNLEIDPMPGVRHVIAEMHRRGIRQGVCTSTSSTLAPDMLRAVFGDYVWAVLNGAACFGDQVRQMKPNTEGCVKVAADFGFQRGNLAPVAVADDSVRLIEHLRTDGFGRPICVIDGHNDEPHLEHLNDGEPDGVVTVYSFEQVNLAA